MGVQICKRTVMKYHFLILLDLMTNPQRVSQSIAYPYFTGEGPFFDSFAPFYHHDVILV